MAYLDRTPTLSAVRDLLLPAVWATNAHAGRRVREVDLHVNNADNSIDLCVRHRLFDRREIEDNSYKYNLANRLYEAILVTIPTAKDLRDERRRLRARGETAQKHKPRKIARKARA